MARITTLDNNNKDGISAYPHHQTPGPGIPMYHPIPDQLSHIPSPMFSDILPLSPTDGPIEIPPLSYTIPVDTRRVIPQAPPLENEVPMPGPSRCRPSIRTDAHPYPKRRPHSHLQVELSDDEELPDLSPNATEQQKIEYKRHMSTLAARRSRKRKEIYMQKLEQTVDQLTMEAEEWRSRAEMAMATLVDNSTSHKRKHTFTDSELPDEHLSKITTNEESSLSSNYPKRRPQPDLQVELSDDKELGDLPPNATDQEKIEYRRNKNTLAARRSQKRKQLYRQELEQMVNQLTIETEKWKSRAEMAMVTSVDDSTLCKRKHTFMDSDLSEEQPSKTATKEQPRLVEQQLRGGDFLGLLQDHNETRVTQLEKILNDAEQQKVLLQSKGDNAQAWLDLLQLLGDYPSISTQLRSSVFSVMIRLTKNSGLHPKCLSIQNVKKIGDHPVGGGGFGDVWQGVVEDSTLKHTVCLKVVRMFRESNVEQLLQGYLREAIVWRQLRHRNVLPFLGLYFLDGSRQQVCLVSPWMEKGNLVKFLKTAPPEAVKHLALAYDVASGLAYLHSMKVVHGDLKGLNILITIDLRACIADFGLSRISDTYALCMTTSTSRPLGTARWLSPELLRGGCLTSKESDVYAYGCVCYEIFTGLSPFHEIPNEMAAALQVLAGSHPIRPQTTPGIPDSMWLLMEECWAALPSSRPRAGDVLTRFTHLTPITPAPEWNNTIFTQMWSSVDYPSPSLAQAEFDRLLNTTVGK